MASAARQPLASRRLALLGAAGLVAVAVALSPRLAHVHPAPPAPVHVIVRVAPRVQAPVVDDGCGGGSGGAAYHLTATSSAGGAAGSAWIAPALGDYRVEQGGVTSLRCGDTLATVTAAGTLLRSGLSPAFLGGQADLLVVDALRAYLAGGAAETADGHRLDVQGAKARDGVVHLAISVDGRRFLDASIDRRIPLAQAGREGLFTLDPRTATRSVRELIVGSAPRIPVTAYWLGPQLARGSRNHRGDDLPLHAVTTVERSAAKRAAYAVYYETPSAQGATSAVPGVPAPFGELQVTSETIRAPRARAEQRLLTARGWPATPVRLANGEQARVVPYAGALTGRGFAVVTRRSLVTAVGLVSADEALQLARSLRPLPAWSPLERPHQR